MANEQILIAGPSSARPFLENLCRSIDTGGVTIRCALDLATPSNDPNWTTTTIFVTFGVPCDDSDMASAQNLQAIITPSLGYEGIDVEAAARRGIAFANGRVAENFESVAEAAMMFMLMALYRVRDAEERLAAGVVRAGPPRARMLKGKTVGIIGHGNIAQALIARLEGWGAHILVANRSPIPADAGAEQCELDRLIAEGDILLPLLPLTGETEGLISKSRLLAMKAGAILINLSRGAIVDEAALTDPEVVAHLGTIILDVFTTEPLPLDSPLRALPDRILTNHEISHTQENLGALFQMVVANIRAAIAGTPLPTAFPGSGS